MSKAVPAGQRRISKMPKKLFDYDDEEDKEESDKDSK